MPAWLIVILSILAVVLVAFIVLLILGGRLQKKANSQQEALASAAQTVSMLIIDKKKLKITEANLPKVVTDQVPKYARRAKFPIVKARVVGGGSKPMNLIADATVFDILPVGKECKVVVSGIYITEIKSVRGGVIPAPPKKKGLAGLMQKASKNAKDTVKDNNKAAKDKPSKTKNAKADKNEAADNSRKAKKSK